MKHYIFGLLIITMFGATSCEKLDQQPAATVTRQAVFGSETGLQLYTSSFYEILPTANTLVRGDEIADFSARTSAPDFLRTGAFSPDKVPAGAGQLYGM